MTKLILLLSLLPVLASAQIFSDIIDAPQHVVAAGVGIGPSTTDIAIVGGFGERLTAGTGTYSYTGVSVVPAFVTTNGKRTMAVTPVTHTGLKQIVYQGGRTSIAIDAGAGASLPSSGVSAFNFSAVGGVDIAERLNKALRPSGNNYVAVSLRFTGLSGSSGGTSVSLGLTFLHGM